MNARPAPLQVFIASASEGLELANILRDAMCRAGFLARVWNESTFKLSQTFIESLEAELKQVDFAILTMTPDDKVVSRGKARKGPRDNVVFELGLFMGHLGRDRAYFVFDKACDPKIPTDLLGVVPASYTRIEGGTLQDSVATVCDQMARRMRELKPREKMDSEEEAERESLRHFSERAVGTWCQRMQSQDDVKLSFFRISGGVGLHTLSMEGDAFGETGKLIARWRSTTAGIRVSDRTVFYSWEGEHPTTAPGIGFSGFGQFNFKQSADLYTSGDGFFADIQAGKDSVLWKAVEIRRVDIRDTEHVERVLREGSDDEKTALVNDTIRRFKVGR